MTATVRRKAQSRKIQSRVPGDIQAMADKVIEAAGLTVSDVVRVLMTRIAKDREIPPVLFQPNAETLAAFDEVERGALETVTLDDLRAAIRAEN